MNKYFKHIAIGILGLTSAAFLYVSSVTTGYDQELLSYLNTPAEQMGATITTLNPTDTGSVSRTVINNNFANLNSDKFELSDWYSTSTKFALDSDLSSYQPAGSYVLSSYGTSTYYLKNATTTSNKGIDLSGGCFAINGTCVGGSGSGSGTVNSGTAGHLAYYRNTGTAIYGTSTIYVKSNGYVGIKNANPSYNLDVTGTGYITGTLYVGGGFAFPNSASTIYNTTSFVTIDDSLKITGGINASSTLNVVGKLSAVYASTTGLTATNLWGTLYGSATDLTCTDCIGGAEISDVYALNTGDTITGMVTLDDDTGDSPILRLTNENNNSFNIYATNLTAYGLLSSTLPLKILMGDSTGALVISTAHATTTINATMGNMVIVADGGRISFNDNNLVTTGKLTATYASSTGITATSFWGTLYGTASNASNLENVDLGTLTNTKFCTYDSANTEIDCNSDAGGSGSGTVNSGTTGHMAYYATDGTAVSGTSTIWIENGGIILHGWNFGDTTGGAFYVNPAESDNGGDVDFSAGSYDYLSNGYSGAGVSADGSWFDSDRGKVTGGDLYLYTGLATSTANYGKIKVLSGSVDEYYAVLSTVSLSGDQSFSFPDQSGTFALSENVLSLAAYFATTTKLNMTVGVANDLSCTDCINATEIEDIYLLDDGDVGTGNFDFGGATFLEIPNGTGATADDPGEITHDTSDNQLVVDDYVIPMNNVKIWSATIASTSQAYISAGLLKVPTQLDGYTMTAIRCSVQGGTSKVIAVEDESTNSTEDITCATSVTADDGSITNASVTAAEEMYIDFGATSGTVDYVSISVFGTWTRE